MKPYKLAPRVRLELVRCEGERYRRKPIRSAQDVWDHLREDAGTWDRERFLALALDGRHRPVGIEEVSVGTATASLVHPREVFKAILLANASAVILVHNHPSGDPTPSQEDRHITDRLRRVAEMLGIRLLDHIVLAPSGYYSFAEHKHL